MTLCEHFSTNELQMDTIPENRSRPYATGPKKTLIYLFLGRRGTGPIFVKNRKNSFQTKIYKF